ncbi:MAG: carboxypeptidase regulatory-like domain-containing protein [Bryobacteraceae bacterium]
MRTITTTLSLLVSLISITYAAPVAGIKGYVKDASGAVVPRATVVLTSTETNARHQDLSDDTGLFQFVQLPPGAYEISAEATGFKKALVRNLSLLVDQVLSVDIRLEVGQVAEVLEVKSAALLIETEKASTGANISPRLVQNLPLGNRRFDDLALLTPGTAVAAPGTQAGGFAPAGARPGSTNSVIDGINNVDRQVGGPINTFRIADAVREFSVTTTVASAEFGRESGGQVNIVTKSGTNLFHGSAFFFLRNDALQARDFFTNKLRGSKPILRQDQFGGTVGGPILHDKTFFFYSWEHLHLKNPKAATAVVPTQAQRDSVLDPVARNLLSYYPLPTLPNAAAGTTNFVGNALSSTYDDTHLGRIDQNFSDKDRFTARYIWYGGTTIAGGALPTTGGNVNKPGSQNLALTETHLFSPSLISELRLGFSRNVIALEPQDHDFNAAPLFPGVPGVVDTTLSGAANSGLPTISISGGYATLGSATNVRQGRVVNTYDVAANVTKIGPFGWSNHTLKIGFDGRREETKRFINGSARGLVGFTSFANFAGTCPTCNGQALLNTSSILAGDTLAYWYRYPLGFYAQDDIKVKPNFTLNIGLRYELPSAVVEKSNRGTNFWDGIGPVLVGTNRMLAVDPSKTGPASLYYTTSPITLPRAGTTSNYDNIAPVFGFAYTPQFSNGPGFLQDGKTVLRGGFRIGYDETYNNVTVNQTINPPWNFSTTQQAGTTQPAAGYRWALAFNQNIPLIVRTTQAPGAPALGLLGFNGLNNHAPTSYAENWNLGIQRQLGQKAFVDVSYIASAGHRLGGYVSPNQPRVIIRDPSFRGAQAPNEQIFPFPQWGTVRSASFDGNSIYNALVVSGKWQGGAAFTAGGSYTWSHGIENVSSFAGTTGDTSQPDNRFQTNLERSNSSSDQRQRFIAYYVYQLPFGRGRKFLSGARGITEQVLGGWEVSGITNLFTGQPFTVYANKQVDFSGFNTFLDRPDIVGSGPLRIDRSNPDSFFDPAYFGKVAGNPLCSGSSAASNVRVNSGCAPAGRVGTSPRNGFYGPGIINFDVTMAKHFPIHEGFVLTFRTDAFNVANHTNFGLIANNFTMSSGQFGQISATSPYIYGAARVLQLTLRLDF